MARLGTCAPPIVQPPTALAAARVSNTPPPLVHQPMVSASGVASPLRAAQDAAQSSTEIKLREVSRPPVQRSKGADGDGTHGNRDDATSPGGSTSLLSDPLRPREAHERKRDKARLARGRGGGTSGSTSRPPRRHSPVGAPTPPRDKSRSKSPPRHDAGKRDHHHRGRSPSGARSSIDSPEAPPARRRAHRHRSGAATSLDSAEAFSVGFLSPAPPVLAEVRQKCYI